MLQLFASGGEEKVTNTHVLSRGKSRHQLYGECTGGRAGGGRAGGREGGRAGGREGGRAGGREGGRAGGREGGRAGGRADGRTDGRTDGWGALTIHIAIHNYYYMDILYNGYPYIIYVLNK